MNRNELPTVAELYELEERLYNRISSLIKSTKPKVWVRTPELKKILGITDSTAQNLRNTGALPCSKIRGTYYYKYEDVMELLERNKVEVPHHILG
ncbi:MAG: helix-turn-helix domain-containing protein [Bacteroidales bacterium]|nr:helix-turn-helix domain-containing protein [Bacteroidales bacterium]